MEKSRYVKTVEENYPIMRNLGHRINIKLPVLTKFSEIDKITIYLFMENFLRKQRNPLETFNSLQEQEAFDISDILGKSLSGLVTNDILYDMVRIYDKLKTIYPSKNGWHILGKFKK